MKYTYRIIDDHYLEMGGEPYEYGEVELVTFLANEIKPTLFEKALLIVMDQTDKKEWSYLHRRIKCKIFEGEKLVTSCAVSEQGYVAGDDGGGWEAVMNEDEEALKAAAKKTFSPEYLKLMADVAAGKRNIPKEKSELNLKSNSETIAQKTKRARALLAAKGQLAPKPKSEKKNPKINTRRANGGKKS